MGIKRKDFQKAAAFIHEFLLKLSDDVECAEVRDTLNLALLHMQKYYRLIQSRSQEKNGHNLSLTARGLSPMTPFIDAPDKFIWRWQNLDSTRTMASMSLVDSQHFLILPPLINAAKSGDLDLLHDILKEEPGCIDCKDGLGRTAVMYAVHFFHHDALKVLLEQRADVNFQAHDESTAVHRACHDANHVALNLLVEHGGDLTVLDVHGRAPIHWAVTTRSTECLQILLSHGAPVGVRDKDLLTPSMWACRMDNIQHFELLCRAVDSGQVEEHDGIERDANGRTWMHWSVRRTQPLECLQTLLTPDSAAIKDKEGKTVLLLAAEMGSLHACRAILEIAGEKCIQDQDNQGRTALHVATMGGHGDVVNFLLEKNADVNVVDNYNATAWDYARIRKLHYCQLIIMSHQRQRLTLNPMSLVPPGLGLFMQTENGAHDDLSPMNFRIRSTQSTPVTPPHPPKRPRSSRILVRRANSLTNADSRGRIVLKEQDIFGNSRERTSVSEHEILKEHTMVSGNTANKRASTGDVFMTGMEDTFMTDSSRPMFEDENDEISGGGMDVSDIEDENEHHYTTTTPRKIQPSRPRPSPQKRLNYFRLQPPSVSTGKMDKEPDIKVLDNRNNNSYYQSQTFVQPQHKVMQQAEVDEPTSASPPTILNQKRSVGPPQARPQARVSPTQAYRPNRGVPVPSPPSSTPQRPHMIRYQQPLPTSALHKQVALPQPPAHESLSPRDGSPLPSQSSESQQLSLRSQGDRPGTGIHHPVGTGSHQPPGVVEGLRIPPPGLSPLQNAPKPPDLDKFDRKIKKKRKKEKRRLAQKIELVPDLAPPIGFAAPLHPHQRSGQGSNPSAGVKPTREAMQPLEPRYVDENVADDGTPPCVSGIAVQIRENVNKSARPKYRTAAVATKQTSQEEAGHGSDDQAELDSQHAATTEDDGTHVIPPPPSFRGVVRSAALRPLSQSVPQDNSSKIFITSAKPPIPKNRNSVKSASPHSPTRRIPASQQSVSS